MALNSRSPAKQMTTTTRSAAPPSPLPAAPADHTTSNGKRKKKKKGKGRAENYDDEDDDELPPLESAVGTTGLSPTLESAHLSANAALDKARVSREELEATATQLYNHMLETPGHFGADPEEYWKSLPPSARELLAQSTQALSGDPNSRANTMYAMAQTFIQTGKMPTKVLPGSYPMSGIPFELSDPAIKRSLEAAFNTVAPNGVYPPMNYGAPHSCIDMLVSLIYHSRQTIRRITMERRTQKRKETMRWMTWMVLIPTVGYTDPILHCTSRASL